MPREIKFRIWERLAKKMMQWDMLKDHYQTMIVGILDEPSEDWIPMQFTGLKDKNGKEIYEGDVLLIPDEDIVPVTDEGQGPLEPCNHIVPVEFRDGEFGFEIPKSDDGETGWQTWRTWNEYSDPKEIEIIGNIWENPELLK